MTCAASDASEQANRNARAGTGEFRAPASHVMRAFVAANLLLLAIAIPACGSDSDDDAGAGGSGGQATTGTGGNVSVHGGSGGTSSGGNTAVAGRGGSGAVPSTGGTGASTGGSAGRATAGTGASGGSNGGTGGSARGGTSSGASGGNANVGAGGEASTPPAPTDDGLSPYTVDCNESTPCSEPSVTCLGIRLDEGGARFTCSNGCDTKADCSDAPSGTDAKADCVQFTSAKHCVLVCYDAGTEAACPDGMGCYRYPNSPIGYCLWL